MWKALLLSVALSVSTSVNAFDLCEVSDAPDQYEYIPDVPIDLHVVEDMDIVRDACLIGSDFNVWGCHIYHHDEDRHEIFIWDSGDIRGMNCALMHEYAHVNGWPPNHED